MTRLVGAGVLLFVTVLMAWDHLIGNEPGGRDPFPVDPGAFVVAMAASLVCAALVFGMLVPRTTRVPHKAPTRALWLSALAAPLTVFAGFLGFPLVLAGGGIALGLLARSEDGRHRLAVAAIALGALVLVFGVVATAFPPTAVDDGTG